MIKELTIEAKVENVDLVTDFINEELDKVGFPMKNRIQIDIVIDEIFSNIVKYAYAPTTGNAVIKIAFDDKPKAVRIEFVDEGVAYNPLEAETPNVALSAEDRGIGGLGIFLSKKLTDNMTYEREGNLNILTIVKNF